MLTAGAVLKMSLELTLGICIKLFCDNGRIHWRDFVNDFLFWVPGVNLLDGDGLTRQVEQTLPLVVAEEEQTQLPLAAK
ncbi:MAG: hypothetical protein ABMA64_27540 [Myxococcota bacterium]